MTFFSYIAECFKSFLTFLGLFKSKKPFSEDAEQPILPPRRADEVDDSQTSCSVPISSEHRGSLRFSVQYFPMENRLRVTILDAKDLPAMDANGKADPYVELSVRPSGSSKKFQTDVKNNCLNPTFNQSFDFILNESVWNDEQSELFLKLKDKDIGTADELIGVVQIPLGMLDLKQIKTYHCLLLDDTNNTGNGGTKTKNGSSSSSAADTAQLNLKISELTGTVYDLEQQIQNLSKELEDTRARASEAKTEALLLKIEHAENYSPAGPESDNEFGDYQSSPPSSLPAEIRMSAPIAIPPSGTESEISSYSTLVSKSLLKELKSKLKINEETIAQLKHQNETLQRKMVLNSSRYGQIEVGLVYHPVAGKLEIHCFNASGIQAVNFADKLSDPFVKIKVWRTANDGSPKSNKKKNVPTWKFQTQVIWECLAPVWNEIFIIEDVREEDLEKMSMQLVVCDASKIPGKHRPLGQIKIAPNMAYDNYHWEEMMKNPGELVKMTHPLQQI